MIASRHTVAGIGRLPHNAGSPLMGALLVPGEGSPVRLRPNIVAQPRSIADWVTAISGAWSLGRTNTLGLARLVCHARGSLSRGEWHNIWKTNQLPFRKGKGDMLVHIGRTLGGLNAHNCEHLPAPLHT